jgi:o-succinylbenzoate synthase
VSRAFRIPLLTRFRGQDERRGLLLHGPCGWGEFSPFSEYPPQVARRWLHAAQEATSAVWPEPRRWAIPVNVTVPAVSAERAHALVRSSGCGTAKVKVAEGDDEGRVEAVRDALGRDGKLRVDANGAWSVDEARRKLARLARYDLEYAEQPVASLSEMARLRRVVDIPLAVDEPLRHAAAPADSRLADCADIVVLKVQPLGGVWPALAVAEQSGLPAVVSSALETSIGISAGLALAAALDELPYACGLATVAMLAGDVVDEPLLPKDGVIELRRPEVSEEALSPWEMDRTAWLQRARAAEEPS